MMWDEAWLRILFTVNGDGELIIFDFGNTTKSKISISGGKVCVNLYPRYSERKKECRLWVKGMSIT